MKELLLKYGIVKINVKEPEMGEPYSVSQCVLPVKVCEDVQDKEYGSVEFSNIMSEDRPENMEKLESEEIAFLEENEDSLKVFNVTVLV